MTWERRIRASTPAPMPAARRRDQPATPDAARLSSLVMGIPMRQQEEVGRRDCPDAKADQGTVPERVAPPLARSADWRINETSSACRSCLAPRASRESVDRDSSMIRPFRLRPLLSVTVTRSPRRSYERQLVERCGGLRLGMRHRHQHGYEREREGSASSGAFRLRAHRHPPFPGLGFVCWVMREPAANRLSEPSRVSWRLHFLGGWSPWEDRVGTHRTRTRARSRIG